MASVFKYLLKVTPYNLQATKTFKAMTTDEAETLIWEDVDKVVEEVKSQNPNADITSNDFDVYLLEIDGKKALVKDRMGEPVKTRRPVIH